LCGWVGNGKKTSLGRNKALCSCLGSDVNGEMTKILGGLGGGSLSEDAVSGLRLVYNSMP